jgi:hypothetical protein
MAEIAGQRRHRNRAASLGTVDAIISLRWATSSESASFIDREDIEWQGTITRLIDWIFTGTFSALLIAFLVLETVIEWCQRGYTRLRGRKPPPAVWTVPVQPQKWR